MTNKIIYDASKGFEIGVPARDLTPDEWDAIPKEVQEKLLSSGMYSLNGKSAKELPKQDKEI